MKVKAIIFIIVQIFTISSFAADKKVPTLKSVMQDLGKAMDKLNHGIFYEDFEEIEKAAYSLANHPKPKTQLPIVIKTLNVRMLKFKGFDSKVHDSATDIVELAKKKNMSGILKKHKVIMNNCVACHSNFRSEISNALLEK